MCFLDVLQRQPYLYWPVKLIFAGWAEFVKWIFGIYAAGNVGEHVSKKVNVTSVEE